MFVTFELFGCLKFGDSLIRSYRRWAVVSASPHRGMFQTSNTQEDVKARQGLGCNSRTAAVIIANIHVQ